MMLVGLAVLALVAVGVVVWFERVRRGRQVRERFGPEYERTVHNVGTPAKAEAVLAERARRVERFKLRPLSPEQADAFGREWKRVQAQFVDQPDAAVGAADRLVTDVMAARGYPIEDFDRRADDLSVDHPVVVENYRTARALILRRERGDAGTEELRQAVINYRAMFDDLLETTTQARRRAS